MLPERLYEALPALYFVVGLFGLTAASNTLGVACGLSLMHSGYTVYRLRRMARAGA